MARRTSRRALKPGDATRDMMHNAEVRRRLDDERAKHRDKLADLSAQRQEVTITAGNAPALAARLERNAIAQRTERDRHRRALDRLADRLHR